MDKKIEYLISIAPKLPPYFQKEIENLKNFAQIEAPIVQWFCTESYLLNFWNPHLQQNDASISHQITVVNQMVATDEIKKYKFNHCTCVVTTAVQVSTEPVSELLKLLKPYVTPVFIFIHGWEQAGVAGPLIEEKINEAFNSFSVTPIKVFPVGNEKLVIKSPKIHSAASSLDNLSNWLELNFPKVKTEKVTHLETELNNKAEQILKKARNSQDEIIRKLKYELNMATRTRNLHHSPENPVSDFLRIFFDEIQSTIFKLKAGNVIRQFQVDLDQSISFAADYYIRVLSESLLKMYREELASITNIEQGAELAYQNFEKNIKEDWNENLKAWKVLTVSNSKNEESSLESAVENIIMLKELENKLLDEVKLVIPDIIDLLEKEIHLEFTDKKKQLKASLANEFAKSNEEDSSNSESFEKSSRSKKIINEVINSANIFQAEKLESLLQGMIGTINENVYKRIEIKKSKCLEMIHYRQKEVLTNFHSVIINAMKGVIDDYKEDLQLFENFSELQ